MPHHARVLTVEMPLDRIDEVARHVTEVVLPGTALRPGFVSAAWMVDRATGRGTAVTVFDSLEALDGTTAGAEGFRRDLTAAVGVTFTAVEHCEVIAAAPSGH